MVLACYIFDLYVWAEPQSMNQIAVCFAVLSLMKTKIKTRSLKPQKKGPCGRASEYNISIAYHFVCRHNK
jgi:hypothetical protein